MKVRNNKNYAVSSSYRYDSYLNYSYVANLLKLKEVDYNIDVRLLKDSFHDIKSYMGKYFDRYTASNFPDDLKEATLKLFINKHCLYKSATDYAEGDEMDDILEDKLFNGLLDYDDFFDKFSSIPYDVERILDKYMA